MMYLHTRFHMPSSSGSLVITIRPKPEYRLHVTAMLFCILHKLRPFRRSVTTYHFRAVNDKGKGKAIPVL